MIADDVAVLTRELNVRVINCSATGCLVETNVPLAGSTVAELTLQFEGKHFTDSVLVAWCKAIAGSGPTYNVGLRFVWTPAMPDNSLRRMAQDLIAAASDRRGEEPLEDR